MNARVVLDTSDMAEKCEGIIRLVSIQDNIAADHISEEIERKTFPYVPLRDGYLQDSFQRKLVSQSPHLEMEVWYSAIANNYYDYAAIQHEEIFNHPIKGIDHYLLRGTSKVDAEALYAYHVSKVL